MPGKLIVGTIETQNINFDSDTTGLTISSAGAVSTPNTNQYELIRAYRSTSNGQLTGSGTGGGTSQHIYFTNVFSSDYLSYKLVVGFYSDIHGSTHNFTFRFLTGTNTEITNATYRQAVERRRDGGAGAVFIDDNNDRGVIFRDASVGTNSANGGIHGELNIMNVGDTKIAGGTATRSYTGGGVDVYVPITYGTFVGLCTISGDYERQDSFCRYNTGNVSGYYTGFCLMGEPDELAGTHMALYGLRSL